MRRYPVLAFVLCLVMAYCAEEFFGVADITGAYAAGLVISCTSKATYIQSKYDPLGYLLLTPVFFASIGMKQKGQAARMNWQEVNGKSGICHVTVQDKEKKDGSGTYKKNQIDKLYPSYDQP